MKKPITTLFLGLILISGTWAERLSLPDCLKIALQKNPQIVAAKENANVATAKMGETAGLLLPSISLDASCGTSYVEALNISLPPSLGGGSFSTSPNKPAQLTSYTISARQNLFDGGKTWQAVQTTRIANQIAYLEWQKTTNSVSYNVIAAYYNVLKAKKMVETIDQMLANLKRHWHQAQVFLQAGMVTPSDVLRAEAAVASAQVSKIDAANGYELAQLALLNVMGDKNLAPPEAAEFNISDHQLPDQLANKALNTAWNNRPEWQQYELGLKVAKNSVIYSWGGFLPNLSYLFSSGRNAGYYSLGEISNYDLATWRSMVVASWNIFDGFITPNKVRETYSSLAAAEAQEKSLRDAITLDVNSSVLSAQSAQRKLEAAQIALAAAKKAVNYAEVAYKNNTGSNINYLDALSVFDQAETTLWSARYDYEVAKAKINLAVGTNLVN